jgi:hypothetical protein
MMVMVMKNKVKINVNFLIYAKSWNIFLLFVSIIFLPGLFYVWNIISYLLFTQLSMLNIGFILIWQYTVVKKLHSKFPKGISINISYFKRIILCTIIILWVWPYFSSYSNISFIIYLNTAVIYSTYLTAKSLVTVEQGKLVSFYDVIGVCIYIWMFPIGIWSIQPRIQKVLKNGVSSTIDP